MRQYGPRTSLIERPLRSAYGFDDVEIISRKSEISVTVKRHGVELRPVDYFSESHWRCAAGHPAADHLQRSSPT
jgi:exonuclease SbcC